MHVLASNTRQARSTRMLTWVCTILPVGPLVWGVAVDAAWILIALIGAGFAGGMHLFLSRYVTSLAVEADVVIVRTAAVGSPVHRVTRSRIGPRTYMSGPGRMGTHASAASPMIKFRIEGFRMPFTIDADIEGIDLEGIQRL